MSAPLIPSLQYEYFELRDVLILSNISQIQSVSLKKYRRINANWELSAGMAFGVPITEISYLVVCIFHDLSHPPRQSNKQ